VTSVEPLPEGARRPILVTGMPRSGTTWVARVLEASGQVGYLNEPFNLAKDPGTVRVPVAKWFPYITEENETEILPSLAPLLSFRYPLALELTSCRNRTQLLHTVKSWWGYTRSRGRRPLVKEPHAVFSAEWFANRLASDTVVMVRHPAAVVSSWKRLDWTFDFANLLEQPHLLRDWLAPFERDMRAAQRDSVDLVDRVALLWDVVHRVVDTLRARMPMLRVVRHEDVALEPVPRFRDLYAALGLAFTPAVEATVARSSSPRNPTELRREEPHAVVLASAASLGNWRHRLDEAEIGRIRRRTEETAALYYPEDKWSSDARKR